MCTDEPTGYQADRGYLYTSAYALAMGAFQPVPWWGAARLPVPEPTRVAFAGCWHADPALARQALNAAVAAGAQVLVHTGDFLYTGSHGDRLVAAVEDAAAAAGIFVVVVRGNHDDPRIYAKAVASAKRSPAPDGFARLSPHVLHAPNGMRWTWSGVTFGALGGAHSVDRAARREGVSWWVKEVASVREVNTIARGGPLDVLVCHDVPAGADLPFPPDPPGWWDLAGANEHRRLLRRGVDGARPGMVVCGHMHFRHSGGLHLADGTEVVVEVLDQVQSSIEGNLLVVDLRDGALVPIPAR